MLIALCGVVLSAFQLNADGVDGNLARVQKRTGFYGDALDNIGSDYASISFLTLIAYMTGELPLVLLSSFTIYIVVIFRQHVGIELPDNYVLFFRMFFYTPILHVFFPFLIIIFVFLGISILKVTYFFTLFYLALSALFLILTSFHYLVRNSGKNYE